MNVLIVDDLPRNRKLLRAQLEAEGLVVSEANDGVDALVLLNGGKIDAVISDILMPGMDGYRFCYEVRQNEQFRGVLPARLRLDVLHGSEIALEHREQIGVGSALPYLGEKHAARNSLRP